MIPIYSQLSLKNQKCFDKIYAVLKEGVVEYRFRSLTQFPYTDLAYIAALWIEVYDELDPFDADFASDVTHLLKNPDSDSRLEFCERLQTRLMKYWDRATQEVFEEVLAEWAPTPGLQMVWRDDRAVEVSANSHFMGDAA